MATAGNNGNLTPEELQLVLEEKLKCIATGLANVAKKYTDEKVSTTAEELKQQIVDELSKIDGLGAELEKIKQYAEAFKQVFDANGDDQITAEEILAKFTALQANINAVAKDVEANTQRITDVENALQQAINDVVDRVKALELRVGKVEDDIVAVKADLSTNYYTKSEIQTILDVNCQNIIKEVEAIFYPPQVDNQGDGQTL